MKELARNYEDRHYVRNWNGVFCVQAKLLAGRPRNRVSIPCREHPDWLWCSLSLLVSGCQGFFTPDLQRPRPEAEIFLPSVAGVKSEWSYKSVSDMPSCFAQGQLYLTSFHYLIFSILLILASIHAFTPHFVPSLNILCFLRVRHKVSLYYTV